MTTAYYSAVLDQPLDTVWAMIRDFNNYPAYIDGVTESIIEDDKRGDEVGAVRRFNYAGNWIRQRLGAHSDKRHSLTYVGIDPFVFPENLVADTPSPARYQGTMHLLRITQGERTLIEWSVTLDTTPSEADTWRDLLLELIPDWTASLERTLERKFVRA